MIARWTRPGRHVPLVVRWWELRVSPGARHPRTIEAALAAGYEVVVGMGVAADFASSGVIDVELDDDGEPLAAWAGHAVLVVGYDRALGRFEAKNSWGLGAGNQGYIRLTYDYIRTHASAAGVVLQVRSGQLPSAAIPAANGGPSQPPSVPRAATPAPPSLQPPRTTAPWTAIASDIMATMREPNPTWSLDGCTYTARDNTRSGDAYFPFDVRVILRDVTLVPDGAMSRLVCRNSANCVTYARVPGAAYPPNMAPHQRPQAWTPNNLATPAVRDRWKALVDACATAP